MAGGARTSGTRWAEPVKRSVVVGGPPARATGTVSNKATKARHRVMDRFPPEAAGKSWQAPSGASPFGFRVGRLWRAVLPEKVGSGRPLDFFGFSLMEWGFISPLPPGTLLVARVLCRKTDLCQGCRLCGPCGAR